MCVRMYEFLLYTWVLMFFTSARKHHSSSEWIHIPEGCLLFLLPLNISIKDKDHSCTNT